MTTNTPIELADKAVMTAVCAMEYFEKIRAIVQAIHELSEKGGSQEAIAQLSKLAVDLIDVHHNDIDVAREMFETVHEDLRNATKQ